MRLFLALGISLSGLPPELQARVPFSQADFVTDNELRLMLQGTSATAAQVEEAVAINADGWLRALQASFLIVGGISLLAICPAARLPKYAPGELSAEDIVNETNPEEPEPV